MPSESSCISPPQDGEINGTLPSLCSSNAPIVEGGLINQSMEVDVDSICAILNKQLASLSSFEDIKPVEFSIPQISWSKMARRRLIRSLESYTEEREDNETKGETMRATEVLQGIEKCIKAFWMYVKTDQKKPRWKMSKFMWTYPPVEDPRDLELLANLTKTLRKVIPVTYLHSKDHIPISVAEIWRTPNFMHF
ncbi:hypothetical protein RHMOL_Rhmol12G0133500 [Rhododendron molle]|uniref:Uncharacterized protein n=1 Tax=Rhododendron molle TaxID=49168 RepID=A0ACC0LIW6_RHOML|nr:hypothetical protein RHMOL_Rhmol12G0133500 [Rhododendron molle]